MAVSKPPHSIMGTERHFERHLEQDRIVGMTIQTRQTIALVGDSLLMDIVEATLKTKPGLKVVRLSGSEDMDARRRAAPPDLIIVDLQTVDQASILTYLLRYPGVQLLAVEANSDRVIALSSQHYTAECSDDLTQIIKDLNIASESTRSQLKGSGSLEALYLGRDAAPLD
ncbi:MAG: hypothetical protein ACP5HS_03680 [Anaerolineae bacterium]